MKRCVAITKSGRRCLNGALDGRCCHVHGNESAIRDGLAMIAGAVVANAIAPGLGSIIFGGLTGKVAREIVSEESTGKKRVFVSFDFDNDRALKHFILGQTKHPDSRFEIIDHSLHEAAPENEWERKARRAISRADIVLVIVGRKTHSAQGVLKEVAMARELGVKIVQVIGYRNGTYRSVPGAGRLYRWNQDNLKNILG